MFWRDVRPGDMIKHYAINNSLRTVISVRVPEGDKHVRIVFLYSRGTLINDVINDVHVPASYCVYRNGKQIHGRELLR